MYEVNIPKMNLFCSALDESCRCDKLEHDVKRTGNPNRCSKVTIWSCYFIRCFFCFSIHLQPMLQRWEDTAKHLARFVSSTRFEFLSFQWKLSDHDGRLYKRVADDVGLDFGQKFLFSIQFHIPFFLFNINVTFTREQNRQANASVKCVASKDASVKDVLYNWNWKRLLLNKAHFTTLFNIVSEINNTILVQIDWKKSSVIQLLTIEPCRNSVSLYKKHKNKQTS